MIIEDLSIEDLTPYENNPRLNEGSVDAVANSIKAFGFRVPIVIDKNNVIIAGHTRYKASRKIGLKSVPCIRADDLTDEQVKAFRIADNSAGEASTWDFGKLEIELGDLSFDMSEFGLDVSVPTIPETDGEGEGWYGDERERTNDAYNLDLVDYTNMTEDFWQMPKIRNDGYIPKELVGFNYAKTSERKDVGIHFYVDDYQFERIWNAPEKYVDLLKEYECILSPDFSLYMDMPMPMKIWNIYRSRQIGAYYQSRGIRVIPTLSWAEDATFEFCFLGIPEGSIVSVSTVGVKTDDEALAVWYSGMRRAMEVIKPSAVLVYGGKLDFDYGKAKVIYYENQVLERWKGLKNDED